MFNKIALAAACGVTMIATPVLAGGVDEVPTAKIEYRDLNLASPEGQAALDRRIDVAARSICNLDQLRTGTRVRSRSAKQCYDTALKSAKSQVAARIAADQRGG